MRQIAPHNQLEKIPSLREKVETIEILKQTAVIQHIKQDERTQKIPE